MKRTSVAILLGIATTAISMGSACAQGRIFFNNYAYTTDAKITYLPGSAGLNNTFTAGLWYFLGTATLSVDSDVLPSGWELSPVTAQFAVAAAGYFNGPIVNIPDYVSGPITFSVIAYNGTGFNSPTTTAHGNSAGFTLPSIATGTTGAGDFGPGFTSFALIIPEPSIFALAGLGAAALMLIRRKK